MATVAVYPRLGTEYDDAAGVPITSAGAIVDVSKYIMDALKRGYLLDWDPLDIFQPDDRTGIPVGGGSGSALQNQAALVAAAVPVSADAIEVLGCLSAGDGGGCLYRRITSNFPPVGIGGEMVGTITAGDGSTWVYVPDTRGVNVRAFGALGAESTAEENTRGIQNAIIFDMYYARSGCTYIPSGTYAVNDTIHVGYGVGFYGTSLEGDGPMFGGVTPFGGTAIVTTLSDRPCISIQGGRDVQIRRMTLVGPNYDYVVENGLGHTGVTPGLDDSVIENWIGPTMDSRFNSRYAPCGAVVVDGYSGDRPVVSYPDVTYPSFLGVVAQYNKSFSSSPALVDLAVQGFCAPLVVQPCDADGNGDFAAIRDCKFTYNVYGAVSVGNSQSRTLQGVNVNCAIFHTGMTNTKHGRQTGKIGSEWQNCNFGACIQWFDIPNAGAAGPVRFSGCYGEQVWRIGTWGSAAASNCQLTLDGCEINFSSQDPDKARGVPATVLDSSRASVSLKDCFFNAYRSVCVLGGPADLYKVTGLTTNSTVADTAAADVASFPMYQKVARNFTCDGIMFGQSSGRPTLPYFADIKPVRVYNLVSGAAGESVTCASPFPASRTSGIPAWTSDAQHYATGANGPTYRLPPLWRALDFSTVTASRSGLTLTITGVNAAWLPHMWGGTPGDVIFDPVTKSVFFVRSYDSGASGGTILAELQNNYVGTTPRAALTLSSGLFYFGQAKLYLTDSYTKGTFNSASTSVTSVGRTDSFGGTLTTWMANGDRLYPFNGEWVNDLATSETLTVISSVTNGSPGSFALAGFPLTSGTRDIGFIIRQPPANV
jgi:hypothetical protein